MRHFINLFQEREKKTETLNCDFEREKDKYATLGCDFGTKEEREIVRLIKENPFITQKELQQKQVFPWGQ